MNLTFRYSPCVYSIPAYWVAIGCYRNDSVFSLREASCHVVGTHKQPMERPKRDRSEALICSLVSEPP